MIKKLLPCILGASLVAAVCVLLDSLYYQTLQVSVDGKPCNDLGCLLGLLEEPWQWPTMKVSASVEGRQGKQFEKRGRLTWLLGKSGVYAFKQFSVQYPDV